MSSDTSQTLTTAQPQAEEPYIPVEELAQRLDIPLALILRRIEAGDVPARRLIGIEGSGWGLRLSDLGIEPGAAEDDGPERGGARSAGEAAPASEPEREPAALEAAGAGAADDPGADLAAMAEPAGDADPEPVPEAPLDGTRVDPHSMFSGRVTRYERGTRGPRAEVAGMVIDSRELVSGLLDRWEHTLEQRIHIELRQRFEAELNARQNLVKQLQLELQTARAEHAAYAADRDRRQAELERQVSDLQRELATTGDTLSRRRGLFHRR